jgi:hypothetical protein
MSAGNKNNCSGKNMLLSFPVLLSALHYPLTEYLPGTIAAAVSGRKAIKA